MEKKTPANKPKQGETTREERLKQALKANMARRKAQTRARDAAKAGKSEGEG